MGIMNPCNSFAADGAELGITKENCAASFKKMAGMGNNEENMVAMTVLSSSYAHLVPCSWTCFPLLPLYL